MADGEQKIGEIRLWTSVGQDGQLRYRWTFQGLNDLEIMGLLTASLAKRLFQVIGLLPVTGDPDYRQEPDE